MPSLDARRRALRALVAACCLAAPARLDSQSLLEVFRLAPDSPLATDGAVVFAVADDRKTLLVGGGSGPWNVLARQPTPDRISGLAWCRDGLYVSDEEAGAVYLIREPATPGARPELIRKGLPLRRPSDLAFAGTLLVGDPGAAAVFRLPRTPEPPETLADGLPAGSILLAADRSDLVVVSPDAAEVRQPPPSESVVYQHKGSFPFEVWRTTETATEGAGNTLVQRRYPHLERPSAPALVRRTLFLVDGKTGDVYVGARQQKRLARVTPPPGALPALPSRLLPFRDSLLVLDSRRGVLSSWPLPVPTEIDLGQRVPEALETLYAFLYEGRILPTRTVAWRDSLERTLRTAGVSLGPPGDRLRALACTMNRAQCRDGQWPMGADAAIQVPDITLESVIDVESVDVDELGDRTVEEEVNRRVVSPAFADYKGGDEVWELNKTALKGLSNDPKQQPTRTPISPSILLRMRRTDFPKGFRLTLPTERVRSLVALPRHLLREDSRLLDRLRLLSPGFSWMPLEETEAKAYGAVQDPPGQPAAPPPPVPCDMAALAQQRRDLLATIHYEGAPVTTRTVNVGVVEVKPIDQAHSDFAGQAFSPLPAHGQPPPASQDAITCREKQVEGDHGTAVAALIAGRAAGELGGLAPAVQIVPMQSEDTTVGRDILDAFRFRKVRIFNLSLHYANKLVRNIRERINNFATEALFVVAAGNDATDRKPICESSDPFPAYPVCQDPRNNVLIVAATNLAGDALIEKTEQPLAPGSNWNERLVEIAAPGVGFSAAARGNSYAPVRGTSFATPLVTATAAMLFGLGVTDPWLIKQRIIATADTRDNLLHKVRSGAFLNVKRAITAPSGAVLDDGDTLQKVEVEPTTIEIVWDQGARSRRLPLQSVRRLTKNASGATCRVIYLDDITNQLIIQDEVNRGPWPFQYRALDGSGQPTGPIQNGQLENFKDYVGPII